MIAQWTAPHHRPEHRLMCPVVCLVQRKRRGGGFHVSLQKMSPVVVKRPSVAFSEAAQRDLHNRVGAYCTALIGVKSDDFTIASGTLVTVGGRGCVLTAHHVLYGGRASGRRKRGVRDFPRIGVYGYRGVAQPTFPREHLVDVCIGSPKIAGEPDLAALILPDGAMAKFTASNRVFYNLLDSAKFWVGRAGEAQPFSCPRRKVDSSAPASIHRSTRRRSSV